MTHDNYTKLAVPKVILYRSSAPPIRPLKAFTSIQNMLKTFSGV